jgi:hypothetical protein
MSALRMSQTDVEMFLHDVEGVPLSELNKPCVVVGKCGTLVICSERTGMLCCVLL